MVLNKSYYTTVILLTKLLTVYKVTTRYLVYAVTCFSEISGLYRVVVIED